MTTTTTNPVLAAMAAPDEAAAWLAAKLAVQTDVADVRAALRGGAAAGFVLLDVRGRQAWEQGHIPGARHLPHPRIAARAAALLDPAVPVVTYCWGPGCDGATRGALALARLGYRVKEMIGGIEYWIREGLPVRTAAGLAARAADPLTALAADPLTAPAAPSCDC